MYKRYKKINKDIINYEQHLLSTEMVVNTVAKLVLMLLRYLSKYFKMFSQT